MEERKNSKPLGYQLIQKIKDYIFPINVEDTYGTCFFFKVIETIYLCISYDLISPEFIKSRGSIKINKDLTIHLNYQRPVLPFGKQCKLILINKEEDKVPDKYIFELDSPTEIYKNRDAFMFAYSYPFEEGGGGLIQGKIFKVEGYKIIHQFNTKNLLFVSPICVIKDDQFILVGIQLESPDFQDYKYVSYGYLIFHILNSLNIKFTEQSNSIPINYMLIDGDTEKNDFLVRYAENADYSFYTFEQYEKAIYYLHFRISRFYNNQTQLNFNSHYNFLNKPKYYKYLNNLRHFKNITNNQFLIFNNIEIAKNFNEILLSNDLEKIKDFSYFIAGYMYVLNSYSFQSISQFRNDRDLLYTRMKLKKKDLERLYNNIDKLITFKTFLLDVFTLETLQGKILSLIFNFKKYFSFLNVNEFDTKIYILHKYKENWKSSCYTLLSSIRIFNLFTFFKVKEVKIDNELKYAEVKLELVGRNEIFENKIGNKNKEFHISYLKDENRIQII